MFKEDGSVLHFSAPKVHAAVTSNTYAIYGRGENKELTELVPGILNQLGPDSLASLRRMAEAYNAQSQRGAAGKEKEPDDDDIPVSRTLYCVMPAKLTFLPGPGRGTRGFARCRRNSVIHKQARRGQWTLNVLCLSQ